MVIRRYDPIAEDWFEGEVGKVWGHDHETQSRRPFMALVVEGYAPSPLEEGQIVEIVSKAELYNREMDRSDEIFMKNREHPYLPLHDGE
jgi:hypothetical protein